MKSPIRNFPIRSKVAAVCLLVILGVTGCSSEDKADAETASQTDSTSPASQSATEPVQDLVSGETPNTPSVDAPTLVEDPVVAALLLKGIAENEHFQTLKQPFEDGPDTVTITEFFWYGCSHCMNAEPLVNAWKSQLPNNSQIAKLPAIWNRLMELHARIFFIVELEAKDEDKQKIHAGLFEKIIALREDRVGLIDQQSSLRQWLSNWGISEARFDELVESGNIQNHIDATKAVQRKANISGTPAFIVGGKYYLNSRAASEELSLIELGNSVVEAIQLNQIR